MSEQNPFKIGDRVKVAPGCEGLSLHRDNVYTVMALTEHFGAPAVLVNGEPHSFRASRFVLAEPVKAEAIDCICGPGHNEGRDQRCPEHGRRCAFVDCDKLCAGVHEWQWRDCASETMRRYCNKVCFDRSRRGHFPAVEQSPADPYAAHREHLEKLTGCDEGDIIEPDLEICSRMVELPANQAARARMVAALTAELSTPTSKRRAALGIRYDSRPGIDDFGGFSGPGWDE